MEQHDRVAVFADVHGKSDQLKRLIEKVKDKYPSIEMYSLGDLIDRGPDSKGVIELCIQNDVRAIFGNHDQWIIDLSTKGVFDPFCIKPIMGGIATLLSYEVDRFSDGINYFPKGRPDSDVAVELVSNMSKEHRDWLAQLPAYRKISVAGDTYWLIHAGLTDYNGAPYKSALTSPITYFSDDEMMKKIVSGPQISSILWQSPDFGGKNRSDNLFHFDNAVQIFGHRPNKKPIIKPHFIAMDTGCGTCAPYTLSAIILPEKEIISVREDLL